MSALAVADHSRTTQTSMPPPSEPPVSRRTAALPEPDPPPGVDASRTVKLVEAAIAPPLERIASALNAIHAAVEHQDSFLRGVIAKMHEQHERDQAELTTRLRIDPLLAKLCRLLLDIRSPRESDASEAEIRLGVLLCEEGVTTFTPTAGEAFDPDLHTHMNCAFYPVSKPENAKRIHAVRSEGFVRGGRVILPARVVVTKFEPQARDRSTVLRTHMKKENV